MKKIIRNIFFVLLIGVIVSYFVPTTQQTFTDLFDGQNKSMVDSVMKFRAMPTQSFDYNGQKWQYLRRMCGRKTRRCTSNWSGFRRFDQSLTGVAQSTRLTTRTHHRRPDLASARSTILFPRSRCWRRHRGLSHRT